ncbi:hypothetical protein LTR84_003711 [Exophiala bonariae]|uniref:Prolyl 4-hydroxylase alpha subunit domain-containing protein n=1 Tax=Exophiala bonariae TaxID=1690606 RepID=A0AAV9N8T6_9EURO|nr:hypothetical protein LTR84_003711 [Exophiala bonariae]
MKAFTFPADFLAGPGPEVEVTHVDFSKTDCIEYKNSYAVILDHVLSPDECAQLVTLAEQSSGGEPGEGNWERALVNIGMNQQKLLTDIRNCDRIIWDAQEIVDRIWQRCKDHVPEIEHVKGRPEITGWGPVKRKEDYALTRLNERMRFLKYTGGEYFNIHCDGTYLTPDQSERSFYTLHLYLNERDAENDLVGGATTFHGNSEREYNVFPKTGRVLLFQQRSIWHSGQQVDAGVKYTMRTDVMFKRVES